MNKEDVVRMLREAANGHSEYSDDLPDPEGQELAVLTKFAELVAAEEREACAKACEGLFSGNPVPSIGNGYAANCAAAIRMRSNAVLSGKPNTEL